MVLLYNVASYRSSLSLNAQKPIKSKNGKKTFPAWLRNRLIFAGIEQVQSITDNFPQILNINHNINTIFVSPDLRAIEANKTGLNLIFFI